MISLLHATAMFVPGFLRLGRLHLPVYGLFAAAGLVAALALSQRTARFVGITAEKLWDAGLFTTIAAFLVSRMLLVATDPQAFLKYPLLVMSLPSLTYGGMALTGLLVGIYLRWKRLPLLDVLDAWGPCAALLGAVLSLGHYFEGTDAGMPTRLPWGIVTPGDTVLGRVHPVQLYALVAWLVLCVVLLQRLSRRLRKGEIAGYGLLAGGVISFALDMLRQPVDSFGDGWLDPSQWIALGAIMIGVAILARKSRVVQEKPVLMTGVGIQAGVLGEPQK
jgi:phosphatidylglycerol---prolipoprotein diacylglyceryl transferase